MIRFIMILIPTVLTFWRFGWQGSASHILAPPQPTIEYKVIYGEDNRKDLLEESDAHWRQLASSTVALFDEGQILESDDPDYFNIDADHYGQENALCEDEPFYDQPTGAFCSGFLIEPDVVVTAGHCIRNEYNCEAVRFVFGYHYTGVNSDPLKIPQDWVYACQDIIHTEANGATGSDFALIRLDRPVLAFAPLDVRTEGQVEQGDRFTVVGYPKGIPAKLAHGGHLRDNEDEIFFVASLDTFGGNSGSAVFNTNTRKVEGLIVRGETDFKYDKSNKCRRSFACEDFNCRGEDVVRIAEVLKHLVTEDMISSH
jgi:V8-like Glu-specific endopeptidase